jgi:metacaspase-1
MKNIMLGKFLDKAANAAVDLIDKKVGKHNGNSYNNTSSSNSSTYNSSSTQQQQQQQQVTDDYEGASVPLSTCTGTKKSLFIGINYFGQNGELRGCINDVKNIKSFITSNFHFPTDSNHMRTLTDDNPQSMPTRANIISSLQWLVANAKSGDSLFFHYSGHGSKQRDTNGDEADGYDETIVPVDHLRSGQIVDDELHDILVAHLPKGVRLTCIMDCCHSGSVLDLPYSYGLDANGATVEHDNRKELMKSGLKAGMLYATGQKKAAFMVGMQAAQGYFEGMKASKNNGSGGSGTNATSVEKKTALADVIQFSGCRDDQTSADANIGGQSKGAMSHSFISSFEQHGHNQTYVQLLRNMRTILRSGKYSQVPQMSTGHKMNMNTVFNM